MRGTRPFQNDRERVGGALRLVASAFGQFAREIAAVGALRLGLGVTQDYPMSDDGVLGGGVSVWMGNAARLQLPLKGAGNTMFVSSVPVVCDW